MKKSGFTLVELLLVIAVIGILSGLLFTAVFSVSRESNKKRNEKNKDLIHAAIMEYRHDTGKWPIPDDDARGAQAELVDRKVPGSSKTHKGVVWTLTYGKVDRDGRIVFKNNDVVVEHLLDGRVGSTKTKKTYLDLRPFITTLEGTEKNYLSGETEESVSAFEVWRGGNAAASGARPRKDGKNIPLVYRDEFIQCPICGTVNFGDASTCRNTDHCNDIEMFPEFKEKPWMAPPHEFTEKERKDIHYGVMPYVITFDFVNNTCKVEQ